MNIKDIDLNLLVSLNALIETRNVTSAAEKIGVTQPAMSNILSRLRATFDDRLLVKAGREMELTPKAKDLALPLQEILSSIQNHLFGGKSFDPGTDEFHFRLAFHDYEQLVIYSQLLPNIVQNSPGLTLEHISPRSIHPVEDLAQGVVDFSTGPVTRDKAGILQKRIFSDSFACLAHSRNSVLKDNKKLTVKRFGGLDHVFIAPHGGASGRADTLLREKGLTRRVRLSVTDFSIAPWLLSNTDLVVTLPRRAAILFAAQHKSLVLHDCPLDIEPIDIYLSWHERISGSPAHQWLKEQIVMSCG